MDGIEESRTRSADGQRLCIAQTVVLIRMINEFEQANRAYELMTLEEREMVLTEFAKLEYPSIRDRFFEAVFRVIQQMNPHGGGTTNE